MWPGVRNCHPSFALRARGAGAWTEPLRRSSSESPTPPDERWETEKAGLSTHSVADIEK